MKQIEDMIDIKGFDGCYKISMTGEIYSVPRYGSKGGFIKYHVNKNGYPCVYLSVNNKVKTKKLHRVVAENLVPNPKPDELKYVNHIDGNKLNYHPSNLEWCTMKQNIRHAWKTGLSKPLKGERNGSSKISDVEREQIVRLYATSSLTQDKIAAKFGISQSNVALTIKAFLKNLIDAGLAIDKQTMG